MSTKYFVGQHTKKRKSFESVFPTKILTATKNLNVCNSEKSENRIKQNYNKCRDFHSVTHVQPWPCHAEIVCEIPSIRKCEMSIMVFEIILNVFTNSIL